MNIYTAKYVFQNKLSGLGNFIQITPTIEAMAKRLGGKIQCLFESDFVRDCFLECPFIEIINTPVGEKWFGPWMINTKEPDYIYVYKLVTDQFTLNNIPHTYIDTPDCNLFNKIKEYAVLINGSADRRGTKIKDAENYTAKKDPGPIIYQQIASKLTQLKIPTIAIGSLYDFSRGFWHQQADRQFTGHIREALSIIKDASYVISNDSGLYHAASAMNKDIFCIWKDTNHIKNRTPNFKKVFVSLGKVNWYQDFEKWIVKGGTND